MPRRDDNCDGPYALGQVYAMTGKKSEVPEQHNPFTQDSESWHMWWLGFRDECDDAEDALAATLGCYRRPGL